MWGIYKRRASFAFEKGILGVYLSTAAPLDDCRGLIGGKISLLQQLILSWMRGDGGRDGDGIKAVMGGLVATEKRSGPARTGQLMAFITAGGSDGIDGSDRISRDYENNRDLLTEDEKLFIRGRVSLGR